ncbi:hypothetical protein WJX77_012455 [Trebouxia sp. C0004]
MLGIGLDVLRWEWHTQQLQLVCKTAHKDKAGSLKLSRLRYARGTFVTRFAFEDWWSVRAFTAVQLNFNATRSIPAALVHGVKQSKLLMSRAANEN